MKLAHKLRAAILAVALLTTSSVVSAIPLSLGSGWQLFNFGGIGSFGAPTFEIDVSNPFKLTVTDGLLSGDRFGVYLGGEFLGLTSDPTSIGDDIGLDWDAAATDSRWSTGIWDLPATIGSIMTLTIVSPYDIGTAALRIDSIPDGGFTLILLGLSLSGLALLKRRFV